MGLDRTSGFDLLIQISENELNAQVAMAAAAGLAFPSSFSTVVTALGLSGRLDLNLGLPVLDLDRPRPQIGFTVPFTGSQFEVTAPVRLAPVPLAGTLVIVDAVQMRNSGGGQQAVLDFTVGAPQCSVGFDSATQALLAPLLAPLGATVAQAELAFAARLREELQTSVQRIALTPNISVASDSDPLTPFSIEVTTVNDSGSADRDALCFGVRTSAAGGGNINAVTTSFIGGGSGALLMLSNNWLLSQVIRRQLATAMGRPLSDFDLPCRLNRPVPAPGGEGTLTNLEARVEGNRIRVDGRATASGTGWSAVSQFHFFITLALSGGNITVTSSTPVVDTDVSIEVWVWLLTGGLGALFGGLVGAIVGFIVPAVLEAVAEGLVDNMLSSALTDGVGSIPPLPLGPIGSGITLANLVLDDLELRGPVQRQLALPVRSQGSHVATAGFTLDLDAGTVHGPNHRAHRIDLDWDPSTGLAALHGSGLTISAASYGALTPLQLRSLPLSTTHLHAGALPFSLELPFFGTHAELVMGVRTNQGRLAKLRAWRDALAGGALHLHWTTYDTPVPTLDIALRWSVLDTGADTGVGYQKNLARCTRFEVARRATIEAWPRLLSFPVDFRWCLDGQVLAPGEGEVATATGPLRYRVAGRGLTLETEMGQAVDSSLCVSAIDARGRELFSCTRLHNEGSDERCGPTPRLPVYQPRLAWLPCDPLVAIDHPAALNAAVLQAQLQKAWVHPKGQAVLK